MKIAEWFTEKVKGRAIYLAPKNDLTMALASELALLGFKNKGFVDSFKIENDVIHPNQLTQEDALLIFSPNYWQEIVSASKIADVYIFYSDVTGDNVGWAKNFEGYADDCSFNSLFAQRMFWTKHLKEYMDTNQSLSDYGFSWGDPESSNDELGNYLSIAKQLQSLISKSSHVVELGTLGGKWTKYLLEARKITCVDINDAMISAITIRYPESIKKIDFYVSSGDELHGVDDNSADVIFCVDTLVRSSVEIILSYLQESFRVLKPGGVALFHLPSNKIAGSVERGFTDLSIDSLLEPLQSMFSRTQIDNSTLKHGALLMLEK